MHPLTPYYAAKGEWLPVRGQADRIGYRDWLGLVQSDDINRPARAVAHVINARWQIKDARLVAYGFASTNTLVTGWCSGEMPLVLGDRDTREIIERTARALVDAADHAAKALAKAVKAAGGPNVNGQLWEATEAHFWSALANVTRCASSDEEDAAAPVREEWATTLRRYAYECFDRACPIEGARDVGKVVSARYRMMLALGNTR
jgi:CRISPR type I-E-associated protein CasA/Cse1